jgi:hypothetical protein
MKRLITFFFLLSLGAFGQTPLDIILDSSEIIKAEGKLQQSIQRELQPTLFAIQLASDRAVLSIEKHGIWHGETRRSIERYLMMANTPPYFDAVMTKSNEDEISQFMANTTRLVEMLGIQSGLSGVTKSTYEQIKELMELLQDHPISEDTRILTNEYLKRFADLFSTTNGEDTLPMLEKGRELALALRADLYPLFDELDSIASASAFTLCLEIRGLNEFYLVKVAREY